MVQGHVLAYVQDLVIGTWLHRSPEHGRAVATDILHTPSRSTLLQWFDSNVAFNATTCLIFLYPMQETINEVDQVVHTVRYGRLMRMLSHSRVLTRGIYNRVESHYVTSRCHPTSRFFVASRNTFFFISSLTEHLQYLQHGHLESIHSLSTA